MEETKEETEFWDSVLFEAYVLHVERWMESKDAHDKISKLPNERAAETYYSAGILICGFTDGKEIDVPLKYFRKAYELNPYPKYLWTINRILPADRLLSYFNR